ncbi:glycosyltransferase family 4 protein [Schumannella luteola]
MTTLRVIIDDMLSPTPGGTARYTEELAAALIRTAPRGCAVEAFVAASPEPDYQRIAERLPGLAALHKSALARRELLAAWQHGFTRLPGNGMLHATSLFAPLSRHDRLNDGDQVAVTVHDTIAWSHPESLSSRQVAWHKAMLKRAEKYADAIVVPSHTVAAQLADIADLGDRVRVIAGAPSSSLELPADAAERAEALALPDKYVLAIGGIEPRRGIDQLIRAMARVHDSIPLLLAGHGSTDDAIAAAAAEAGLGEGRVRSLGTLSDPDLAVALSRATVFAYPNREEGFGMPMLEAFAHGTPVIHSDAPALVELAADSGITVERDGDEYPVRIADAINSVLSDDALAERLKYIGLDRAKAFTWRGAAEQVWQLHADL